MNRVGILLIALLGTGLSGCRPAHPYEPPNDRTLYNSDDEYYKAREEYKQNYKEAAKDAEYNDRQY